MWSCHELNLNSGHWDPAIQVEKITGLGVQAQKRRDDSKPSCLLPSPSSLSGTPDPRLRPEIPSSSRNPGSPPQGPVAQFPQEASAWGTTLSPVVDSGVQRLPKREPETDLSPKLPAAHLIGKHLLDLKSTPTASEGLLTPLRHGGPFPTPPPPSPLQRPPSPVFPLSELLWKQVKPRQDLATLVPSGGSLLIPAPPL